MGEDNLPPGCTRAIVLLDILPEPTIVPDPSPSDAGGVSTPSRVGIMEMSPVENAGGRGLPNAVGAVSKSIDSGAG